AALEPVGRGQPLTEAAATWARRASSPDEALLAEAVQLSAWTGRPEPALFYAVADSARERRALAGELHAQTAQARASAIVLVALRVGVAPDQTAERLGERRQRAPSRAATRRLVGRDGADGVAAASRRRPRHVVVSAALVVIGLVVGSPFLGVVLASGATVMR